MTSLLASKLISCSNLRTVNLFKVPKTVLYRNFANDVRQNVRRARQRTVQEQAMSPAGEGAFTIGKGALAGGAVVGIGALCYYGLGFSNEAGAAEKSVLWPDYVKKRIRTTYMYFGSSLIVTGASAIITFSSTSTIRLLVGRGLLSTLLLFGVIMITGSLAHNIPYKEGFGKKQLAWLAHTASLGTALAPLCFLGGPMLIRAAMYTAGLIGGLTLVAVCAPGSKFLSLGGPLAMGLGVVLASSIGSLFFPATSTVGSGLYVIVVYGGLMLFSVMLLYDTQRIIFVAERYPVNHEQYGLPPYDPINAALSIYTDALNIFTDILTILVESESRKRR